MNPITKVEAYQFEDKTYPTEIQAIRAAVSKVVENEGVALKVCNNASALIPLLQRVVELEAERTAAAATPIATEVTSKKSAGEPKQDEWPGYFAGSGDRVHPANYTEANYE